MNARSILQSRQEPPLPKRLRRPSRHLPSCELRPIRRHWPKVNEDVRAMGARKRPQREAAREGGPERQILHRAEEFHVPTISNAEMRRRLEMVWRPRRSRYLSATPAQPL